LISERDLSMLLEECEAVNGGVPITFFEITTAAALLAFSRTSADYLLLEVGLGGRLDATNVVDRPKACCITSIGLDHQQFLGETIELIAAEKAGILKRGVPAVIGLMPEAARTSIEAVSERVDAPLSIAGQDWDVYQQHGRLVFQDAEGLLDLPMPALPGAHQIHNAGNAIAVMRALKDPRVTDEHIATGLRTVAWPARLQRLRGGALSALIDPHTELWLDGGHNADAGVVLAQSLKAMPAKPLVVIWGMLNTKDATQFFKPLAALADHVVSLSIPNEVNAISGDDLAETVRGLGTKASVASSVVDAVTMAASLHTSARILICGSLYLAGHVLAAEEGTEMSEVSGTARR